MLYAELAQYDYDYQEATDGRYEQRPYGPYIPTKRPMTSAGARYLSTDIRRQAARYSWTVAICVYVIVTRASNNC